LKKVPIGWEKKRLNLKHDHWVFTHNSDKKFFKSDLVSGVKTTNWGEQTNPQHLTSRRPSTFVAFQAIDPSSILGHRNLCFVIVSND